MLTEKDYCDKDTCVALKELGYDGYCAAYYRLFDDEDDARNSFEYAYGFDFQNSNNIYRVGAPLLYQAQKWLREEKNIFITLSPNINDKHCFYWEIYTRFKESWEQIAWCKECYDLPEEALLEGIKEAVKILKEE